MKDWQAAIAAYAILFMLADVGEAGPLMAALAWTATVTYTFWAASKGGGLHISNLTGGTSNGGT